MPRLLLFALLIAAMPAFASDTAVQTIRARIASIGTEVPADAVTESPVPGLYSVSVGGDVVYVSEDGRYLLQGDLVDLKTGERITETARSELRRQRLAAFGEENMLIYEPTGKTRHELTVFTDVECPYCRRFHRHIDELTRAGVRVRYIFMPRAGRNSSAFDKAVAVWCADDRQAALTDAKAGKAVGRETCDNPVGRGLELARELHIAGTPTMITGAGRLIPGYRPPGRLLALLSRDVSR